jgi:endonuclease/exonuclease/phosphatase (EEP) superfamily protein YafD
MILAGSLVGQLVVVLTVRSPLQEVSFRWVGLAGVALPVAFGLAVAGTVAAVVAARTGAVDRRRRRLLALGMLVGWVPVAVLAAPTASGLVAPEEPAAGEKFTLLTQNLWYQHPDPTAMAAATMGRDADVMVLVEYTSAHREALLAAGMADAYPYLWEEPGERGGGIAVVSRFPLGEVERLDTWSGAVRVELQLDDGPVVLFGAHPIAPSDRYGLIRWVEDHRTLNAAVRGSPPAVIVAGDLNATSGHRRLRRLMDTGGLRDAHDVAGGGFAATWPASRWFPPVMRLDHILVGDAVGVVSVELLDGAGSDHRGVEARLRVTRS